MGCRHFVGNICCDAEESGNQDSFHGADGNFVQCFLELRHPRGYCQEIDQSQQADGNCGNSLRRQLERKLTARTIVASTNTGRHAGNPQSAVTSGQVTEASHEK